MQARTLLSYQDFYFFIKNTEYQPAIDRWVNTKSSLKRMLELFLNIPPLKKILKY